MDKDHLEYCMKELRSRKGTPYSLGNEPLADEFFPHVKAIYPAAVMVKVDISQYICITKRARNALIKLLTASRAKHENYIAELEKAVNELKNKEDR